MKKSSHNIVSLSALKEIKSAAYEMRWKLSQDHNSLEEDQQAVDEYEALVDRFYEQSKDYVAPQQYRAAKHDVEYFMTLLDLAIHYFEDADNGLPPTLQ